MASYNVQAGQNGVLRRYGLAGLEAIPIRSLRAVINSERPLQNTSIRVGSACFDGFAICSLEPPLLLVPSHPLGSSHFPFPKRKR